MRDAHISSLPLTNRRAHGRGVQEDISYAQAQTKQRQFIATGAPARKPTQKETIAAYLSIVQSRCNKCIKFIEASAIAAPVLRPATTEYLGLVKNAQATLKQISNYMQIPKFNAQIADALRIAGDTAHKQIEQIVNNLKAEQQRADDAKKIDLEVVEDYLQFIGDAQKIFADYIVDVETLNLNMDALLNNLGFPKRA